mmetsp:Transcript_49683/g.140064  ORF Transcript_49683/g.140064 Transcript_49683/m.140064 type:complete len:356 (-) Transcript_49683:558-1625(-)
MGSIAAIGPFEAGSAAMARVSARLPREPAAPEPQQLAPGLGRPHRPARPHRAALRPRLRGLDDGVELVALPVPVRHVEPDHALAERDRGDLPAGVDGPARRPAAHVQALVVVADVAQGAPPYSPPVRPAGQRDGVPGAGADDRPEPQPVAPQRADGRPVQQLPAGGERAAALEHVAEERHVAEAGHEAAPAGAHLPAPGEHAGAPVPRAVLRPLPVDALQLNLEGLPAEVAARGLIRLRGLVHRGEVAHAPVGDRERRVGHAQGPEHKLAHVRVQGQLRDHLDHPAGDVDAVRVQVLRARLEAQGQRRDRVAELRERVDLALVDRLHQGSVGRLGGGAGVELLGEQRPVGAVRQA